MQYRSKTLAEAFADIFHARLFVLGGLVVGALLAAGFIAFAIPQYKAQMIIAPANPVSAASQGIDYNGDEPSLAMRYLARAMGGAHWPKR